MKISKKLLDYAFRIARESSKKKPLDLFDAKRTSKIIDVQEALRAKE